MTEEEKAEAVDAGKRFLERVEQLRQHGLTHSSLEVLTLLMELVPALKSSGIVFHFKKAFPQVPLQTCVASASARVVDKRGISDEKFEALFAPYWHRVYR